MEIDPVHAETVRLIYKLALVGDGESGPLGVKAITTWLNAHNIRTRDGGRWGVASVHLVLTRETDIGRHHFNTRDHKTREAKPEAEHAIMDVPPIVTEVEFKAVRDVLKARSPQWMAPCAVSGPTLLTGICFCAACGGAMTLGAGKGGRYRYYTCSTRARQGGTGCHGLTLPMDKLDRAVADHLEGRLLDPQRMALMMGDLLDRREDWIERRYRHVTELRQRAAEAEATLKRLYEAIENGVVNMADSSLKERVAELTSIRDQAIANAKRATAAIERLGPAVTSDSLRTFVLGACRKLRNEDGTHRRDHLRALAQRVEVVDRSEIRIMGSKTELLRTLVAASGGKSGVVGVRSSVLKWRAREDSNS